MFTDLIPQVFGQETSYSLRRCNLMQLNGVNADDWSGLPAATSVCAYHSRNSRAFNVCIFAVSCFSPSPAVYPHYCNSIVDLMAESIQSQPSSA